MQTLMMFGDTSVVVLVVSCFGVDFCAFCILGTFHILVKCVLLSGHLLGNSCSLSSLCLYLVNISCQINYSPPWFLEWEFLSDCAIS